jgi:hypothetical protein
MCGSAASPAISAAESLDLPIPASPDSSTTWSSPVLALAHNRIADGRQLNIFLALSEQRMKKPGIVQESRDRYYKTGHSCACPDEFTRNGQRCGGRSAYSRPGGGSLEVRPSN